MRWLCHLERCAANPDAYPYAWRDGDGKKCDCGLASAIGTIIEMREQSDEVDRQCGYSGYDKALIEMGLLGRELLRRIEAVAKDSAGSLPDSDS